MSLIPLHKAKIGASLTLLKCRKAPGPDGLPPFSFRDAGYGRVKELKNVIAKKWDEENVSLDWTKSIVIPVFKKVSRAVYGAHRGIR